MNVNLTAAIFLFLAFSVSGRSAVQLHIDVFLFEDCLFGTLISSLDTFVDLAFDSDMIVLAK